MTFTNIWQKILANEGQTYYTKTGKKFVYSIDGNMIIPDRTNYPLHKSNFEKAFKMMPLVGPRDIVLLMNIFSEELWWRGYILPRQEKQHGRYTWAIHGVLWAFFHAFKLWAIPFMLFTTWIIPLISQRFGNTTPGIIIHLVISGLGILLSV